MLRINESVDVQNYILLREKTDHDHLTPLF